MGNFSLFCINCSYYNLTSTTVVRWKFKSLSYAASWEHHVQSADLLARLNSIILTSYYIQIQTSLVQVEAVFYSQLY